MSLKINKAHMIKKQKWLLTSKKDLSSVFLGAPGVGLAWDTDITSARSKFDKVVIDENYR